MPFWENFEPFISNFFLFIDVSLLLPLLVLFSSYCKTIKHNYSKLQAILIKYDTSGMTVSLFKNLLTTKKCFEIVNQVALVTTDERPKTLTNNKQKTHFILPTDAICKYLPVLNNGQLIDYQVHAFKTFNRDARIFVNMK